MTARIARTSCLLAVVASMLFVSSTTANATTTLPGIDVSKWQGTIDCHAERRRHREHR